MEDFKRNNIIQWIFEKAFDQLTIESSELYMSPFQKIKEKTFQNEKLYQLIHKLSSQNIIDIKEYLTNYNFQEWFLFQKTKKKIHTQILLDNMDKIKYLIGAGYKFDAKSLELTILNNRFNILKYIIEHDGKIKLTNNLLMDCSEFGYEEIYFFLREKGLVPNFSIYNKAVLGPSIGIIKDISNTIGLNNKILETAFSTNQSEIILFLLNQAKKENVKIPQNYVTYPLLNSNFELIEEMEKNSFFTWHIELYYSAILSGSIDMVKFVERKIPNIHDNHVSDTSNTKKGRSSLLLEDMVYEYNGKKYFSHCTNYAVQSLSIDMVKYIYSKNYGITVSNIITAIKQSTPTILKYLTKNYSKELPFYLVHYFGTNSYIPDKIEKAKILSAYGLFNYIKPILSINDYKKEAIHLEMIGESVQIPEDGLIDTDYLMKYQMFFVPINGYKLNFGLISRTRICLELALEKELMDIFKNKFNDIDKQFIIDTLFLFGNLFQIKKYHPLVGKDILPSKQILMEIMCYCQINKLCYLMQNNLLTKDIIEFLRPLQVMLGNKYVSAIFSKLTDNNDENPKYIIASGIPELIINYAEKNNNLALPKDLIKNIIKIDNMDIIKKIKFDKKYLPELVEWAKENDFIEIANYLTTTMEKY